MAAVAAMAMMPMAVPMSVSMSMVSMAMTVAMTMLVMSMPVAPRPILRLQRGRIAPLLLARPMAAQQPAQQSAAGGRRVPPAAVAVLLALELALDKVGRDGARRAAHDLAHGPAVAHLAAEKGAAGPARHRRQEALLAIGPVGTRLLPGVCARRVLVLGRLLVARLGRVWAVVGDGSWVGRRARLGGGGAVVGGRVAVRLELLLRLLRVGRLLGIWRALGRRGVRRLLVGRRNRAGAGCVLRLLRVWALRLRVGGVRAVCRGRIGVLVLRGVRRLSVGVVVGLGRHCGRVVVSCQLWLVNCVSVSLVARGSLAEG
ncbi:hypothetical protein B0T25DRAFT_186496 [Lasiosphaeria hispida]|uniref:Uncharacterized protein n=1 Tax=Lasiosphaeria hispida TaxID=260671 RepID=A0AAJ0HH11_9PEZI|nr:hypothetical protein B0T25DRAFT_186496 [Lasiosphaeria hispida]